MKLVYPVTIINILILFRIILVYFSSLFNYIRLYSSNFETVSFKLHEIINFHDDCESSIEIKSNPCTVLTKKIKIVKLGNEIVRYIIYSFKVSNFFHSCIIFSSISD